MGRIAELEAWIENLQAKIYNLQYENGELKQLLRDVIYYHDKTLSRIREKLEP